MNSIPCTGEEKQQQLLKVSTKQKELSLQQQSILIFPQQQSILKLQICLNKNYHVTCSSQLLNVMLVKSFIKAQQGEVHDQVNRTLEHSQPVDVWPYERAH